MIYFIIIGIILCLVLRRNPVSLLELNFKYITLLILPFCVQVILYIVFNLNPVRYSYLLESTLLLLIIGLYLNRKFKGIIYIAIGCLLNFTSIIIFHGAMPVIKRSAEIAGVSMTEDQRHIFYTKGVWWMSDWIPIYHHILSIGDVFVVSGLLTFMISNSKPFKVVNIKKA